jgi:hypothetical protein
VYQNIAGTWTIIANIKGADGDDGATGADGTDGATWSQGSGVPSGGAAGDFYLRTSTYDVYQNIAGTWTIIANIKGADGDDGATGAAGQDGATWYQGSGVPSGGYVGDFYLRTSTYDVYQNIAGTWTIIANIKGADGDDGATGADGTDGTDGATWTSSSSAPSGGVDGDFHLRTSNWDVYKKTAGSWAVIGNIKGADGSAGATGAAGADGTDGATWSQGAGVPSGGVDGDFYLRTTNYDVYQKIGGTWTVIGNIKGADGAAGADGADGANSVVVYTDQTPDNGTYGLLAGTVNGTNKVFTVSQGAYISGRLQVYRNGLLQLQGTGDDYTETTPNSGTFTFDVAPLTGDIITAVYQKVVVSLAGGNLSGALNAAQGTDIASASTTDIAAATGNYVKVTGTTTITSLGTAQAGTMREVLFTGILTLTHNATSLILPTSSDILTAANDAALFVSEGSGNWRCLCYRRFNGAALYPFRIANESVADQSITANTDTIITGSTLAIPNGKLAAGTRVFVRIVATKTAAATATPVWNVRFGTNGTTADTARLTFTGDAQTAAADTAIFEFVISVKSVGVSGVIEGVYRMQHNLATTGFGNKNTNMIAVTSAGFNNTVANSILSISLNSGASAAWTIRQCQAEMIID